MLESNDAEAIFIDENGEMQTEGYDKYLKSVHETNIQSVNIAEEGGLERRNAL